VWAERDDEDAFRAFVDETTPIDVDERPDIEDAATVRLVDRLLALAVRERASDIHIEPHRDGVTVRLRVDGVLLEVLELPRSGYSAVTARLKIISGLDVMERRLPQDGRTRIPVDGAVLDARVSTLPCLNGENLVIRLLPAATRLPSLEDLGLEPEHRASLLRAVGAAQGLVLITGPTGSGKTNTLYALLSDGIGRTRNVITLEDPVEIELAGLTQVQIDERSGLSFARVLRSALRQDPDVILVGEIRDQETAELAVRASLTGHLVLSTLHTMDACAAVTRLADMGVPAYLIGSSLRLVASQRLVRVPCVECAEADPHAAAALESLTVPASEGSWVRAVGCPACNDTGYRGRTALVEVIPFEESLRTQLLTGSSEADLRAAARRCGASSLLEAGLRAASQSRTTLAEVQRVCPDP
jgi:type IV pilus assembly protein PilB